MSKVSRNYREITREEALEFRSRYSNAWNDPIIPEHQYNRVVKGELETFRNGGAVLPYSTLIALLIKLTIQNPSILDVGASTGYYREVLKIANYPCRYTGLDMTESYRRAAGHYFPGIRFDVGDACALPYKDSSFDILLHSACIMHELDYTKAIAEAARVSSKYVIFHRTPIAEKTTYYIKVGYDLEMVEIAFEEMELFKEFNNNGLFLRDFATMEKMKTYVLEKTV